ncbi:MAG: RNA polymerase factor sigma-54 [Pseudomonadota bacterium]
MALKARLNIRQSQNLVMTPQLMQSIKLLQLSNIELSAFVESEIERNPLLERLEVQDEAPEEKRSGEPVGEPVAEPASGADQETNGEAELPDWMPTELETNSAAISDRLDSGLENVFPDDPGHTDAERPGVRDRSTSPIGEPTSVGSGEPINLEAFAAQEITLRDHLSAQAALLAFTPQKSVIASDLIDRVDEDGYMRDDPAKIAERLGASQDDVYAVLAALQGLEPTGVCARSLQQCLALQLRERDRLDPAMQALIDNLDLLAKRDFASLKSICGVDRDDLVDMMQEIQALDPRPGSAFSASVAAPVSPDVFVREAHDGNWHIELNQETLPRVLVNRDYYSRVFPAVSNETEKEFMVDCLQTANWLTKSLDQRAQTILKVATEIVGQQDMFLVHGIRHLKPLNLKSVADAIKMHESTVSRVTSNKFMMTPRGLFEFKFFFTSAIQATDNGEAHSAASVRDRIKLMTDEEDPAKVLSDDAIVDALRNDGIDIARRTVAKYRESMHIPSSVQRRREKKALAGIK